MNLKKTADPDAARVLNSIRRLVRALRLYSRESEGRMGLSGAQLFVLQQLRDGSPVSLKELSRRTMTDVSSASAVVERLAGKGLVARRRSEKDGRMLELWLSAEGKMLLRQRPDALQVRLISAMRTLDPAELQALASGLESLLKAAGLSGEKASLLFESDK
jgi:DNA-binding MarR family transcriptional regulator